MCFGVFGELGSISFFFSLIVAGTFGVFFPDVLPDTFLEFLVGYFGFVGRTLSARRQLT